MADTPEVTGIPSAEIAAHFEQYRHHLESVVERSHGRATLESLTLQLVAAERQLWRVGDAWQAIAITSVEKNCVYLLACTGERREEWQDSLLETIQWWAGQLGKEQVIAVARPGWVPLLKRRGYKEAHREMILEIENDGNVKPEGKA